MKKLLNVIIPALWLLGLASSAQSQTLIETVKFFFEAENYNNAKTFLTYEGEKGNTFSVIKNYKNDEYFRSTYELDNCIVYLYHMNYVSNGYASVNKIDLNKVIDASISSPTESNVGNNIINTTFQINLVGSEGMYCSVSTGWLAKKDIKMPDKKKVTNCSNTYSFTHDFHAKPRMDTQAHINRIVSSFRYIRNNFCKGRAF